MKEQANNTSDISFDRQDIAIFRIEDRKTKLATLQNYFFPRMEALLEYALHEVNVVYGVNALDRMTYVYKPSHRQDAEANLDVDELYVGICGKRRTDRPLRSLREDGKPFSFHSTYLTINLSEQGYLFVHLLPFRQLVDRKFLNGIATLVRAVEPQLVPHLVQHHIRWNRAAEFLGLADGFQKGSDLSRRAMELASPGYDVPLSLEGALGLLVDAFVALYPLAEAFTAYAEGEQTMLEERLTQYRAYQEQLDEASELDEEVDTIEEGDTAALKLPIMDSYTHVRPGRWYFVLARDNWTCKSCGRSTRVDRVRLHVDHIVPRSKGGSDDPENLQTLCEKCNLGKGNRDDTDLR